MITAIFLALAILPQTSPPVKAKPQTQKQSAPTKPEEKKPTMSADFSKDALRALKAIVRYSEGFGAARTAQDIETGSAIDEADITAVTPEEREIVKHLRHLYTEKALNNALYASLLRERSYQPQSKWPEMQPKLDEIVQRQRACFEPLEEAFRAREPVFPSACNEGPFLGHP